MNKIWHRPGHEWPYTVWEGDPNGCASGRDYRSRWRAILAAWWASRYAQQDVWIEHRLPRMTESTRSTELTHTCIDSELGLGVLSCPACNPVLWP